MSASSYGMSLITAGDGAVVIRPKYLPATAKQGVLHAHGAGGFSYNAIDPTGLQSTLYGGVVDTGRVLVSSDYGGPANWGAAAAMTRMTAAYTYLQSLPGVTPGKVVLMGGSMGALCSLNWAAANPTKVSCIVGIIPVVNLTDIVTNNRGGYGAEASAAYGTYSEATYGATYNPKTMAAAGKYAGIPILLFYGSSDALAIPTEVTGFAASVGAGCTAVPVASGHDYGSWSLVDHARVVSFVQANA